MVNQSLENVLDVAGVEQSPDGQAKNRLAADLGEPRIVEIKAGKDPNFSHQEVSPKK